jgi:alpha-L-rhamnosidase
MALVATRLRCNLLVGPLAIAEPKPSLSWIVEGDSNRQTAYQIEATVQRGSLVWDSGKVASDRTSDVRYEGRPVQPRQTVNWRVRVWDENDQPGDWSEWAQWTAAPEKWEAEWIGFDEPLNANRPPDLLGTYWIWHADGPLDPTPVGTYVFRKSFVLDEMPSEARLIGTGDDSFSAAINGRPVGKSDGQQDAWRRPVVVDVLSALVPGENTIEVTVESFGTTVSAMAMKLTLNEGGERRDIVTDATWEARAADGAWKPVRQLGAHGIPPWGVVNVAQLFLPPPRVLQRSFAVDKKLRRATLYATALGLYEASLNGRPVGEDWFAPGWTDYKKRLHYRAYEVTEMLVPGANAIEASLYDGWFAGYVGFGRRHHYGEQTRFSAMLCLDFEDGSSQLVATDEGWRAATGPARAADFLMGEEHDARTAPGDWHPVVMGKDLDPVLEPYPMEPVVEFAALEAESVTRAPNNTWIVDLGQNFAGVPHLDLRSQAAGTALTLRHAEVLNTDGTAYTTNLRSARARDVYTTRAGDQQWSPRGTFHGFRYVEVSGAEPKKDTVGGRALSNIARAASGFECSDERLNRLWSNIDWTFRSNFIEVPTDCPQRDERLGWTGDIEVFCRSAMLLAVVQSFLRKWLVDLADAQRTDGQYPMVAPVVYDLSDGGPAWADAGTIVPWALYEVYGDKDVLARQYDSMKRFVDFCSGRMTVDGMPPAEFHCFGDWLNVGVATPNPVLYMLFLGRSSWILGECAAILGREEDERKYKELNRRVCLRFRSSFVGEDGWVQGNSQTGQVLALAFGLVDEELGKKVFARLVEDVEKRGHLTTGFVGTKDLPLVLRDYGRTDLAYKLLLSDDYPGWLFSIKHGATSIWERWNGWTPDQGFGDPGMNSFAHYAFGAVGQFMMETIGGIRLLSPGYARAMVHVERGPLEWARCWYDSPRGRIATRWEGDRLDVEVPPNMEVVVRLPSGDVTVGAGKHTLRN